MSGRGFVFVELLVAIGAALLVLGIMVATFVYFEKQAYNREGQVAEMQENLRAGMQKMARELPMAGRDPTGTAGAGLVQADSEIIRFTIDLNGDGDVSDADEDVTYALDTKQLQLMRNGQPVAVNIPQGGLEFKYSDRNGHRLGTIPLDGVTRKRVSRINIRLKARTAEPDPEYALDKGYRTKTVSHDALMHNLILASVPTTSTTEVSAATKAKTTEATTKPLKTTGATTTRAKTRPSAPTKATKTKTEITIAKTTPPTTIEATMPRATPEVITTSETTNSEYVDTEGPSISETSQIPFGSPVPNGVIVNICAAVTDPSGVEGVTLLSDKHGSVAMSVYNGETYCSDLAKMNDTVVTYYIIAHDSLGHESTRGPYSYLQGK
ncbi:MAG: hypothetical protein JRJ47_10345 [Deltaproteobacteria bacterium]|nr:hypothetical protein [Deltaproteobacteria bacterium]